MVERKVRLFGGGDEALFLGVPIAFVLAAFAFSALGWCTLSQDNDRLIDAIILILGLQSAHNAFTFTMLRLPEFRAWLVAKKVQENRNLMLRWTAVGLVLFVAYCFLYRFARESRMMQIIPGLSPWQAFWMGFWLINQRHTFRQSYGLSVLYNLRYLQSHPEDKKVQTILRLERLLFQPLLWCLILFGAWWNTFSFRVWNSAFVFSGTAIVAFLLIPPFFMPAALRLPKILFNLRFLLILSLFYPGMLLLNFGLNVNHNYEYWHVLKKTAGKSRVEGRTWFWLSSAAGIVLFVILTLPRNEGYFVHLNGWFSAHDVIRDYLIAATMSVTTLHYFIDGDIFHFSDRLTRQHLAPLLLAAP